MEEFKNLKWSWCKYEEDKVILPRNFSFATINDADVLNRNLNEIHMSVLKDQDEYRLFKTSEEIIANSFGTTSDGKIFELRDPRKEQQFTTRLKSSNDLIDCYSYRSELMRIDHINILNEIEDKLIHNPKLFKLQRFTRRVRSKKISGKLKKKIENECIYFDKCAEIHYHRHIKDLGIFLGKDLETVLIEHWDLVRNHLKDFNFQAVTMIARNASIQTTDDVEVKHVSDISPNFNKKMYTIEPESYFPSLHKFMSDNLKHHFEQEREFSKNAPDFMNVEHNLKISLNVLTKIFVPGNKFLTTFKNNQNDDMSTFLYNYSIPTQNVDCCEALEEVIKNLLILNIEWSNISKMLSINEENEKIEIKSKFPCSLIKNFMEKIYLKFKKKALDNIDSNVWTIGSKNQSFNICISNRAFFIRENVRAIISVKIEYQISFGAEKMTKEELLREWIQQKFTPQPSITLRYRVDAKSLEIISIQELKIEDIENELNEMYQCNPHEFLSILLNLFICIRNLPSGDYLIHAKNENECNKLLIYKECASGKSLDELKNPIKISQSFVRPWIPIDRKILTFINFNEFIAPCCFSHKTINKSSYILKKKKASSGHRTKKMKMNKNTQKKPSVSQLLLDNKTKTSEFKNKLRKSKRLLNKIVVR